MEASSGASDMPVSALSGSLSLSALEEPPKVPPTSNLSKLSSFRTSFVSWLELRTKDRRRRDSHCPRPSADESGRMEETTAAGASPPCGRRRRHRHRHRRRRCSKSSCCACACSWACSCAWVCGGGGEGGGGGGDGDSDGQHDDRSSGSHPRRPASRKLPAIEAETSDQMDLSRNRPPVEEEIDSDLADMELVPFSQASPSIAGEQRQRGLPDAAAAAAGVPSVDFSTSIEKVKQVRV